MTKQSSVNLLNDSSAVGIILLTYKENTIYTTDMKKLGGSYDRLKRVADNLIDGGLLKKEALMLPYLQFNYTLTEKGKKVAEKLIEIDTIIKE